MPLKIAIIGGTGRMGQWFSRFFADKGFEVIISGSTPEKTQMIADELRVRFATSNVDAVQNADIVVVSVPNEKTKDVILQITPYLKRKAMIFDIASVKGEIMKALAKAHESGARAVSLHPLFGPGANTIAGKKILMIPVGEDPQLLDEIAAIFEREGAIIRMVDNAKTHDRIMAMTLSLPHFLNILFGDVLQLEDINSLKEFGGTTFALQLLVAEGVASEDPDLYSYIQIQNEAFHDLLDVFLEHAVKLRKIIHSRDTKAFVKSFDEVKDFFSKDQDFEKAYIRFYKALEATKL